MTASTKQLIWRVVSRKGHLHSSLWGHSLLYKSRLNNGLFLYICVYLRVEWKLFVILWLCTLDANNTKSNLNWCKLWIRVTRDFKGFEGCEERKSAMLKKMLTQKEVSLSSLPLFLHHLVVLYSNTRGRARLWRQCDWQARRLLNQSGKRCPDWSKKSLELSTI